MRFGARRLIIISMSLFGALFRGALAAHAESLVSLRRLRRTRFDRSGDFSMPHASLISRWFTARRGLALGVMMCGTGTEELSGRW